MRMRMDREDRVMDMQTDGFGSVSDTRLSNRRPEGLTETEQTALLRAIRTWRARATRGARRGVTLIEILIVLAIIGLIAGGVAVVAVPQFEKARVTQAKQDVGRLQQAVELWRSQNPG